MGAFGGSLGSGGGAPSGSAGGGLAGSYPNPSIAAGLDATKISGGNVSNAEFDHLNGVTSAIQTQLDAKLPSSSAKLPPAPSGAGKLPYDNGSAYAALAAGSSSQVLIGGTTPSWGLVPAGAMAALMLGLFGDGNDGDVTISGSATLSREMYYNNLTITSSGSLNAAGYIVKVKGTLTIDAGGLLHRNGTTATTNTGGAGLSDNQLYGGGAGGNGSTGAGGGSAGVTNSMGAQGGTGGAAGSAGGAAGSAAAVAATAGGFRSFQSALRGQSENAAGATPLQGGSGGGGGGGSGASNQGGGGGSGGGVVLVHANAILNNGSIEARGGNGAPGQSGNSGGGGGGGGGGIYLLYNTYSGSGTVLVTGGTGGAGLGTGNAGNNGSTGNAFRFGAWS